MNTATFTFGENSFSDWMNHHKDLGHLTITGVIHQEEIPEIDKIIFSSNIRLLTVGPLTVIVDNEKHDVRKEIDNCDLFTSGNEEGAKLLKILYNLNFSDTFVIKNNVILTEDETALIHITEDSDKLVFPKGIKHIGKYACSDYHEASEVCLPDGLLTIGENAFLWCSSLSSVTLPESVMELGKSCFESCNLESLTLSERITDIPESCFEDNNLEELTLPSSLKTIGERAFYNNFLSTLVLPEGVEEVGYLIAGNLAYIHFPSTVAKINKEYHIEDEYIDFRNTVPFADVAPENPYFFSEDGNLYDKKTGNLFLEHPYRYQKSHEGLVPDIISSDNPKTVILKWNPAFSSYHLLDFLQDLDSWNTDRFSQLGCFNWSVYDYQKIHRGDRFFFVKVGYGQTGIIGKGTITSEPYESEDWSGRGRQTFYIDFIPEILVNPDALKILTCEELQKEIPDFEWDKGHSGLILSDEQAEKISELWNRYVSENAELFAEKAAKERNDYVYLDRKKEE